MRHDPTPTRFWLLRHALVALPARAALYGTLDVPICEATVVAQSARYRDLAGMLPKPAHWMVSPLSRTRHTAEAIFAAGYPTTELMTDPDLIEQELGEWQGLPHAELPPLLRTPGHPFWPLAADECPPGGESLEQVVIRVGMAMERLAARWPGGQVVVVSHGGAIRAAIAHAMGIGAGPVLHLSVRNLSLTRMERHRVGWQVTAVNAEVGRDDGHSDSA